MSKFSQKGVSLYLAIIIMVILLAIVLGVTTILVGQLKMIKEMENSVIAFYAADTGIERVLRVIMYDPPPAASYSGFLDIDGDGQPLNGICPDDLDSHPNDACYKLEVLDSEESDCTASLHCIKSVGIYKETRRAIEVEI